MGTEESRSIPAGRGGEGEGGRSAGSPINPLDWPIYPSWNLGTSREGAGGGAGAGDQGGGLLPQGSPRPDRGAPYCTPPATPQPTTRWCRSSPGLCTAAPGSSNTDGLRNFWISVRRWRYSTAAHYRSSDRLLPRERRQRLNQHNASDAGLGGLDCGFHWVLGGRAAAFSAPWPPCSRSCPRTESRRARSGFSGARVKNGWDHQACLASGKLCPLAWAPPVPSRLAPAYPTPAH